MNKGCWDLTFIHLLWNWAQNWVCWGTHTPATSWHKDNLVPRLCQGCANTSPMNITRKQAACMFFCQEYTHDTANNLLNKIDSIGEVDLCYLKDPMEPLILYLPKIHSNPFRYHRYITTQSEQQQPLTSSTSQKQQQPLTTPHKQQLSPNHEQTSVSTIKKRLSKLTTFLISR